MRRALQRLWWCNKIHQVSSPRLCWGETLTKAAKTVASTSATLRPARGMASSAGEKVQPKKRKAKNEFDGGEIRTEVQDDEHWTTIRAGAACCKIHSTRSSPCFLCFEKAPESLVNCCVQASIRVKRSSVQAPDAVKAEAVHMPARADLCRFCEAQYTLTDPRGHIPEWGCDRKDQQHKKKRLSPKQVFHAYECVLLT